MAIDNPIELSSIQERYPNSHQELLGLYGGQAMHRLRLNPIEIDETAHQRVMTIDWKSPKAGPAMLHLNTAISWKGLPEYTTEHLIRIAYWKNDNQITEDAAILIMSLLIHELEGASVAGVAPIGSGGDYFLAWDQDNKSKQVEASGIKEDKSGSRFRRRMKEKADQILQKNSSGYVAITCFSFGEKREVHSGVHFVTNGTPKKKPKGKKPKTKK